MTSNVKKFHIETYEGVSPKGLRDFTNCSWDYDYVDVGIRTIWK